MNTRPDVRQAIAAAARSINHKRTLDETLPAIADVARASVPGFDEVGISTRHNGAKVQTSAATGDLVHQLDDQYGLGEGPCVDTLRHACGRGPADPSRPTLAPLRSRSRRARTVLAARGQALPRRPRHPRWVEPVLDNLRRRRPEAEWTAELFAARAAIALGNARERENLNQALHSRKVIGQAVGILMERYAMNEDRAFAFLVRVSSHANIKLRDVAQELVNRANAH